MPEPMGFYTDTTVCIGGKAWEVACKEWNQLPSANGGVNPLSGDSYDNTRRLDGMHWRHVKFVEQFPEDRKDGRWLLMSDGCKHCVHAACLEVCPTGAIIRTEFDTVVIQSDACNGCRDCISACPFGVIDINPVSQTAHKCTLCYDRLEGGGRGGPNSFHLLGDRPEVYGLPPDPKMPTRNLIPASMSAVLGAIVLGLA